MILMTFVRGRHRVTVRMMTAFPGGNMENINVQSRGGTVGGATEPNSPAIPSTDRVR